MRVTISNRPELRDPEGETILQDLVRRYGDSTITEVRTARLLQFKLDAPTAQDARARITEMCTKLRIYNPLVSVIVIESV